MDRTELWQSCVCGWRRERARGGGAYLGCCACWVVPLGDCNGHKVYRSGSLSWLRICPLGVQTLRISPTPAFLQISTQPDRTCRYHNITNEWEIWNEPQLGPDDYAPYAQLAALTCQALYAGTPTVAARPRIFYGTLSGGYESLRACLTQCHYGGCVTMIVLYFRPAVQKLNPNLGSWAPHVQVRIRWADVRECHTAFSRRVP